jgi:hypothetical protein
MIPVGKQEIEPVPLAPRSAVVASAERACRAVGGRVHRKALPRGRQSGEPWSNEDWKSFKEWALDHGAKYDKRRQELTWEDDQRRHHRTDGPAVVRTDGHESWWLNGQRHREHGPAVIEPGGHEEWWWDGRLHREDGPAIIEPDGSEAWYLNGQRHREDGPARVWFDGTKEWWLNGVKFTDGTFTEEV